MSVLCDWLCTLVCSIHHPVCTFKGRDVGVESFTEDENALFPGGLKRDSISLMTNVTMPGVPNFTQVNHCTSSIYNLYACIS